MKSSTYVPQKTRNITATWSGNPSTGKWSSALRLMPVITATQGRDREACGSDETPYQPRRIWTWWHPPAILATWEVYIAVQATWAFKSETLFEK
jgi:hypothetical protein